MNAPVSTSAVKAAAPAAAAPVVAAGLIDADIHPALRDIAELKPWLSAAMWQHLATFGQRIRSGYRFGDYYPKAVPGAYRADARPERGGPPGSDLELMQRQYLDPAGVEIGILCPLGHSGQQESNLDVGAALARAVNHWQVEAFTSRDKRLKASIVVPFEWPERAVEEIEFWADHPDFAQVQLLTRASDPFGRRRFWPILEAATRHGFPVGIHVFGAPGHASTGAGWPTYYIEDMTSHATASQGVITSLVLEGVFERFPGLKVISIEGGCAWLPALEWRLDKHFLRWRAEVPHLKRPPSEYLREGLLVSTQPIEEPEQRRHLIDIVEMIGPERLLFASDYPHWDFDDPATVLPARLGAATLGKIRAGNARRVYRLAA